MKESVFVIVVQHDKDSENVYTYSSGGYCYQEDIALRHAESIHCSHGWNVGVYHWTPTLGFVFCDHTGLPGFISRERMWNGYNELTRFQEVQMDALREAQREVVVKIAE